MQTRDKELILNIDSPKGLLGKTYCVWPNCFYSTWHWFWKHSLEMLTHIDRIASCSWWRFVGCTSRAWSSDSTTSQRCSIGLRSGECGGHFSTVNSLSCSRNQFEKIQALWHDALSYWKWPWEDGYMVAIKGWTWSETMLR